MSNRARAAAACAALALTLMMPTTTVFAAAPGNDDIATPAVAPSIPFIDTIDTTEATSGGTDTDCYGAGHTVWYAYTATATQRLEANTFGSDYDTTLAVGTDDGAGGISVIDCNDDADSLQSRVRWDAEDGTTYLIQVGSLYDGAGGNLVFNLDVAPPFVDVEITLTIAGGRVSRTGQATISGTVMCQGANYMAMEGTLSQRLGRLLLSDYGWLETECSDTPSPWQMQFFTSEGSFGGGKAQVSLYAYACGEEDCDFEELNATITLRR